MKSSSRHTIYSSVFILLILGLRLIKSDSNLSIREPSAEPTETPNIGKQPLSIQEILI